MFQKQSCSLISFFLFSEKAVKVAVGEWENEVFRIELHKPRINLKYQ